MKEISEGNGVVHRAFRKNETPPPGGKKIEILQSAVVPETLRYINDMFNSRKLSSTKET
jgi:hypothetical protein